MIPNQVYLNRIQNTMNIFMTKEQKTTVKRMYNTLIHRMNKALENNTITTDEHRKAVNWLESTKNMCN